jgi:hypothetical protein
MCNCFLYLLKFGHVSFQYERFFQPESAVVASVFAPIMFPPAPVLVYQEKRSRIYQVIFSVLFSWVLGHTDLGNEAANVTKEAVLFENMSLWVLGSDTCMFLHHAVISSLQEKWSQIVGSKPQMIKLSIYVWHSSQAVRVEEVIIAQLWIGQTCLVKRWSDTICKHCAMFLTVLHILQEYQLYEKR